MEILLISFDAITLDFFIEGETKQPIQLTLSSLKQLQKNHQTQTNLIQQGNNDDLYFYQNTALN